MTLPETSVNAINFQITKTADGTAAVKGKIQATGKLTRELAEELGCSNAAYGDRLPEFQVEREEEAVTLTFRIQPLSLGGSGDTPAEPTRTTLTIPEASLHKWTFNRDANGLISAKIAATFSFKFIPIAADFLRSDAGSVHELHIGPGQGEIPFDEDGDDAEDAGE